MGKEYTLTSRRLALDLIRQVDPKDHPKSKLVVDSAILVDKAREIDGPKEQTFDYSQAMQTYESIKIERITLERKMGINESKHED